MSTSVSDKTICREMCEFCFEVLEHKLLNKAEPKTPTFTNEKFPLFVTLKSGPKKNLRGCIGTFSPVHLHEGLKEYVIQSAFHDSRFDPLKANELENLHVSVSLLTKFEPARSYLDWDIGVHGIRISFEIPKGHKRSATYLPEVAPEAGWNHIQTFDSLLRKSGYNSEIFEELRRAVDVTRYQSEKMTVSYEDYKKRNNQ